MGCPTAKKLGSNLANACPFSELIVLLKVHLFWTTIVFTICQQIASQNLHLSGILGHKNDHKMTHLKQCHLGLENDLDYLKFASF